MTTLLSPLLLLALAPLPGSGEPTTPVPAIGQDSTQDPTRDPTQSDQDPEEVFEGYRGRYQASLDAFAHEVQRLHRAGVQESDWPTHPARDWLGRFVEVAERGVGRADLWILHNLEAISSDPARQRELAMPSVRRIVEQHGDEDLARQIFEYIVPRRRVVERTFALEMLGKLSAISSNPEVAARALFEEAMLLSEGLASEDPALVERALDLLRIAVDGYPGTEGAKFAADRFYNRTLTRLWADLAGWSDQARLLAGQGVPPERWPAFPAYAAHPEFSACANAGHPLAEYWTTVAFPAFEQAARQSHMHGLFEFAQFLARRYRYSHRSAMDARFGILQVLVETWPDDSLMLDLTEQMLADAESFRVDRYGPVLRTLGERTSSDRVRFQAWLALARALHFSNREEEILEARELYRKIEQEAPLERLKREAELARSELEPFLPGAPLPRFDLGDTEGFRMRSDEYRGRAALLVFWAAYMPECVEILPEINRIHEHFAGRRFSVIGINLDLTTPRELRGLLREHGIQWRNAPARRLSTIARDNAIFSFPFLVLVDGEGVIQARGLAAEGAIERIEPLVLRADENAAKDAGAGTGDGGD